jgi:hypothetical protein
MRIESARVTGTPLLRAGELHARLLPTRLLEPLAVWRAKGFVHGDLSPANILVEPGGALWFVDWLVDLDSFAGTPRYSAPPVYRFGRHDFETDAFAAREILRVIPGKTHIV